MKPEIRDLPELKVLYVTRKGLVNGDFTRAARDAFGVLCQFVESRRLQGQVRECLGICPDDPSVTGAEDCRYEAGFVLRDETGVKPEGEVGLKVLPGGRCAVFVHTGPYQKLHETWAAAYRDWMPKANVQLRDAAPFEVYLNDPARTKPEDLKTEIHIPII